MRINIRLSFFLYKSRRGKKGTPVYLRIFLPTGEGQIHTGITVIEKYWNDQKNTIRESCPEHRELNKQLQQLKNKVLAVFNDCTEKDIPVSIDLIKTRIKGDTGEVRTLIEALQVHNDELKKKLGIETSKATVTKYETLRKKVTQFIHHQYKRKDIFLKELDHRFIVNFETYLKTVDSISHNPVVSYIQLLKKIMNMSVTFGWLQLNPFRSFKCTKKETARGFLSLDEIHALRDKEIVNRRLATVRDIFLFSCYTGLAYADVASLTTDSIIRGVDGKQWINSSRKKTGIRITVPLLHQAQLLLDKYVPDERNRLLPVISNQKLNAYLKEIADICQITKKLTFHLARHTFATTVTLSNGVPIETVSKMLGHTNLKTTQIYAKVVDTKISHDMMLLQEKLSVE